MIACFIGNNFTHDGDNNSRAIICSNSRATGVCNSRISRTRDGDVIRAICNYRILIVVNGNCEATSGHVRTAICNFECIGCQSHRECCSAWQSCCLRSHWTWAIISAYRCGVSNNCRTLTRISIDYYISWTSDLRQLIVVDRHREVTNSNIATHICSRVGHIGCTLRED